MKKYATAEQMKKQLEENFIMRTFKAYYLAKALQKATIYMITEIPPKELEKAYRITPVKSVEEALEDAFNKMQKDAKIKVIPYGSAVLAC